MNSVQRMRVVFVVGLAFALSSLLLAPLANAAAGPTTSKKIAVVPGVVAPTAGGAWGATTSTSAIFILGLDSSVYYTLVNTTGAAPITGVSANSPFIGSPVTWNADGFVNSTGTGALSSGGTCAAAGQGANTCTDIWAKVPGAGSFADAPSASIGGPISGAAQIINLLVPGLDSQIYYTLYTGAASAGATFGVSGTTIAANDPFGAGGSGGVPAFTAQPTESNDTGWPSTSATGPLQTNCGVVVPAKSCVGLWIPFR